MKRISLLMTLLIGLSFSTVTFGQIVWVDGGIVGDEYLDGSNAYEELCFITGEPVILKGTVSLPTVDTTKDTYKLTYNFELANTVEEITLSRSVTYQVDKVTRATIGQTLYEKSLTSYSEEIVTADHTYTAGKSPNFLESRVIDNQPAVDFYSGTFNLERTLYIDGDYTDNSGFVTYISECDPIIGYEHQWGANETQVVHHLIEYYEPSDSGTYEDSQGTLYKVWTGNVDAGMATTRTVNFSYQGTDPQNISFRGSYFKITQEENIFNYTYDLPKLTSGAVDYESTRRNTGSGNLSDSYIAESKALITPKIKDIGGHWAQDDIFLMTSLEIFDTDMQYFVPDAIISRFDFAKGVVVAIDGLQPEFTSTDAIRKLRPGVETPYLDVFPMDTDNQPNPDYNYYEYIKENNIMTGENQYFKATEPVTRAQAIAIMVNALGLDSIAPAPPYNTGFADDASIPEWAKDYVYMANEIGIISGDDEGNFNPNHYLTKAEAAAMIRNFIDHIKDDISYDYREKIINK